MSLIFFMNMIHGAACNLGESDMDLLPHLAGEMGSRPPLNIRLPLFIKCPDHRAQLYAPRKHLVGSCGPSPNDLYPGSLGAAYNAPGDRPPPELFGLASDNVGGNLCDFRVHVILMAKIVRNVCRLLLIATPSARCPYTGVRVVGGNRTKKSTLIWDYRPFAAVFTFCRIPLPARMPVAEALTMSRERPVPSPAANKCGMLVSSLRLTRAFIE